MSPISRSDSSSTPAGQFGSATPDSCDAQERRKHATSHGQVPKPWQVGGPGVILRRLACLPACILSNDKRKSKRERERERTKKSGERDRV